MGRFTAYHASERGARVVVLERGRVGDPMTASYGNTRSFRNDYLDATYARLAHEAFRLWGEFEARDRHRRARPLRLPEHREALGHAGPRGHLRADEPRDAAGRSASRRRRSTATRCARRFPYLDADMARLDVDAGVVDLPAVTARADAGARASAGSRRSRASRRPRSCATATRCACVTDAGEFATRSLVVTAGHGTNDAARAAARLPAAGPAHQGPAERGEVLHPARGRARALHGRRDAGDRLPRRRDLLPPDRRRARRRREDRLLQPARHAAGHHEHRQHRELHRAVHARAGATRRSATSRTSTSATTTSSPTTTSCSAPIPGVANAFVGVGWRGTGYKFAPWVGRVLAELALQDGTVYDIDRFDPARFDEREEARDEPAVAEDPAAAPR